MSRNYYHRAKFIKSAAKLSQLPADKGYEVAFVGRSNAGKSSALNVITEQKRLAHVSKTPGRTQLINSFEVDNERRLVDLPGYGFAKVPLKVKQQWQVLLGHYLESRQCLTGLILLMDCRHPLQETDQQIINWSVAAQLKCHILLTKSDKLSQQAGRRSYQHVCEQLVERPGVSIQLFSASKKWGLTQLYQVLNDWFQRSVA
jgi:GTP-binding protein